MKTRQHSHSKTRSFALTLALLAGVGLVGACGERNDQTAGQKIDETVASAERKADEIQQKAGEGADRVKDEAASAKEAVKNQAAEAGDKVSDATITAQVNAALAADPKLSALKINVDTKDGVVTLSGPAPDAESRSRATELAAAPKGVIRVENQLSVANS